MIGKCLSTLRIMLVFFVIVASRLASCTRGEGKPPVTSSTDSAAEKKNSLIAQRIAKGHYWVDICGCHDCHSPKVFRPNGTYLDSTKLLSGSPAGEKLPPTDKRSYKVGFWMLFSPDLTAFVGSWGINYSANITPDSTTGIGTWSEHNFLTAMRTGRHAGQDGGREILPPMPWRKFAKMTDEDLKSIYAYLRTVPPINNQVPTQTPPLP